MSYLDLDLKNQQNSPQKKHLNAKLRQKKKPAHLHAYLIIFSACCFAALFYVFSLLQSEHSSKTHAVNLSLSIPKITLKPSTHFDNPTLEAPSQRITIKKGDSLSQIFKRLKISPSTLFRLINQSDHGNLLKNIKPGQTLDFYLRKNELSKLIYTINISKKIIFSLDDMQFTSKEVIHSLQAVPTFKEGIIESSLFLAASKNNIPDSIIMNMVHIFGWDIDFSLDIRKGDSFKLVYNELYQQGKKITTGKILAAEFTNRNKAYRAFLYTDKNGNSNYYSSDGKSMKKAFLRTPVEFTRITSRFTLNRYHPILKKWRSHKGVDYAAPRGTPIHAAGNGKIIKKMISKSYGKVIFISHAGKYTTVYAHMNNFARGMRKGKRVKQGDIIGFVGSTGYATGPHLHYEFRVNNVHRNPLTVKLPAAKPINKAYLSDFKKTQRSLLKTLTLMESQK